MIYFITAREVGRVKIGRTGNVIARVAAIQSHSPVSVLLERVLEGGADLERELHERFASDRVLNEWFDLTPRIEKFMSSAPAYLPPERCAGVGGDLLAEIEIFLVEADMSATSFGTLCLGDPPFVSQLRNGRNPLETTIARCRAFMRKAREGQAA